jgi:uncharacterized protein with GYD domain
MGLAKDGATGRRAAVKAGIKSVGGKLESMHFAFGSEDVFVIADLPDAIAAARLAVAVGSSGMVSSITTPLLTCEAMDKALSKGTKYRAPGQA